VGKIIHDEKADIEAFAGGTPQSDDITMIVLKFNGPDGAQT
jgi:serine phosphatase RsbU (regulator of sigma subunit)